MFLGKDLKDERECQSTLLLRPYHTSSFRHQMSDTSQNPVETKLLIKEDWRYRIVSSILFIRYAL